MKIKQALEEIGLSKIEVETYLHLLKLVNPQPASIIANRISLNRTTTYKALVNLSKKGLATKTMKHGIICFFAEAPEETLKALIEERKQSIEKISESIIEALPSLTVSEETSSNIPKIRYYEGLDGLKQIYEFILKEGVDYYRYGDIAKIYGTLGDFTDDFIKRRNKLGIKAHAIMPYDKDKEDLYKSNEAELREALYIPYKLFPIEGEVRIFGNKVGILSLKKESPIGILIESGTIARMFKAVFMLTWENHNKKAFRL